MSNSTINETEILTVEFASRLFNRIAYATRCILPRSKRYMPLQDGILFEVSPKGTEVHINNCRIGARLSVPSATSLTSWSVWVSTSDFAAFVGNLGGASIVSLRLSLGGCSFSVAQQEGAVTLNAQVEDPHVPFARVPATNATLANISVDAVRAFMKGSSLSDTGDLFVTDSAIRSTDFHSIYLFNEGVPGAGKNGITTPVPTQMFDQNSAAMVGIDSIRMLGAVPSLSVRRLIVIQGDWMIAAEESAECFPARLIVKPEPKATLVKGLTSVHVDEIRRMLATGKSSALLRGWVSVIADGERLHICIGNLKYELTQTDPELFHRCVPYDSFYRALKRDTQEICFGLVAGKPALIIKGREGEFMITAPEYSAVTKQN